MDIQLQAIFFQFPPPAIHYITDAVVKNSTSKEVFQHEVKNKAIADSSYQ